MIGIFSTRSIRSARGALTVTVSCVALTTAMVASSAWAADATAAAPTKASLDQTQPESIISHGYIEQVTPETGGWTTVLTIAPSVSGITSNGGGVGDYNVVT